MITPHKYQQQILDSSARFIAAIAGVQSGKTMSGALWLLKEIIAHPKDDFLIAAPTYKILEQSTLKKFFEIFPSQAGVYKKQDSVFKLHGGGNIYIRSTEKPDNLEGMTLRGAWLDEAGLMKSRVWINMLARIAAKKGRIIITTTPYTLGWVYNDVVKQAQSQNKDFEYIKWKSIDNPFFPKEEYDRAKLLLSPEEFERRYHGEFRKMEGLVYPDYEAATMVVRQAPDKIDEVWAGVDYGFSNPTSIQVVVRTGTRLQVVDELYQTKLTIDEIVERAKDMKEAWGIEMFYCDPSNPSLIESLNLAGCSAMAANNDIEFGTGRLRNIIKAGKIKFSFGCANLLEEIELYHYNLSSYDEARSEYRNKPDKVFDHAVDALRYAIATHPIDLSDGEIIENKVQSRSQQFWGDVNKRMATRKLRISRWGQDYSDEETEAFDKLWI